MENANFTMRTFEADQFLFTAKNHAIIVRQILTTQNEMMNNTSHSVMMKDLLDIAAGIIDQPFISNTRNANLYYATDDESRQYTIEDLLREVGRLKILYVEHCLHIRSLQVFNIRAKRRGTPQMIDFIESYFKFYGRLSRVILLRL